MLCFLSNNNGNLDFVKESIDIDGARLLLETMGYNSKSIKIANDLNSGKAQKYKMPMARPNDNTESLAYDPAKLDKAKMVDDIETGEARILDASGRQLEAASSLPFFSDCGMISPSCGRKASSGRK